MKKLFASVSLLACLYTAEAQITLENTYTVAATGPTIQFQLVNLELSGYKYVVQDFATNEIRPYNLNHTVWKTINVPSQIQDWQAHYVSERLFNLDNSIECLLMTSGAPPENAYVINEGGSIVHTFNDITTDPKYKIQTSGGGKYKLLITCGTEKWCAYSLPGTIPCDKCGNGLGLGKPGSDIEAAQIGEPVPNPSNGNTTIDYTLPAGAKEGIIDIYNTSGQKLKTYKVDKNFSSLFIDNSEFVAGTYYYYLTTQGNRSSAKKMVVIK